MRKFLCLALIILSPFSLVVAGENETAKTPSEVSAKQRRYEIMILLQAYRLVAPELKAEIKREITTRLTLDCRENEKASAQKIAQTEEKLRQLKEEAQLSNDEKVEREFNRLANVIIGGMGPQGWCCANCAQSCNCGNSKSKK